MADNREKNHVLFFLPKEDYIGISATLNRTLNAYKRKGLDVTGCRVINEYPNKEDALQTKAELNAIGFKGAARKGRKIDPSCVFEKLRNTYNQI